MFVPPVVEASAPGARTGLAGNPECRRPRGSDSTVIEIEVAGTVIRVAHGADADVVTRIVDDHPKAVSRNCCYGPMPL